MTAVALATALCATSDVAGPDLAMQNDIAALFLFPAGGTYRQFHTGQISDFIQ